jgi:hypothetical protein
VSGGKGAKGKKLQQTNVADMFRDQEAAAMADHWQIVSLAPVAGSPGTFKVRSAHLS